jgi:hypothetical protein
MNQMPKISAVSPALALAGLLACSGQALADSVTAKFTGMSQTRGIGYEILLPPDNGNSETGSTTTGIFNFTNASGPIDFFGNSNDQFVSFCIDLEDTITPNSAPTWDVVSLSEAPDALAGPMGATKASDIAKVLGYTISSGVLNDARLLSVAQKQAIQALIWEIVHEDPDTGGYNLSTGSATFSGLTDDAQAEVTHILNNFGNATAMTGLVGLTSSSNQDFIGQVPIPAAAWLFGSAILGAVVLGRRKQWAAGTA